MYEFTTEGITKQTKDGPRQLTNFNAKIVSQTKYHDGRNTQTILTIEGIQGKEKLHTVEVPAKTFASMTWVADLWGMKPIIYPEPNAERETKAAIQINSNPTSRDVYTHIGWATIKDKPTYLSKSGGITEAGLNDKITVALPPELRRVKLPDPTLMTKDAYLNTLFIAQVSRPCLMWPLLIAAIRPPMGQADFALHLAGKTGTFKSELASIVQSHYGVELDARHLPCSWSSTPNALERQTYIAQNALCTIDDFVPYGTAWQVRSLNKAADQIIRAQGNQSGRARLSDQISLQETYYPRGIILSTGEDIPDGHSVRARMLIMEIAPGELEPHDLTIMQAHRSSYSLTLAAWIQYLASQGGPTGMRERMTRAKKEYRETYGGIGHTRTPTIMADMRMTADEFLTWGMYAGHISKQEAARHYDAAVSAIETVGAAQTQYHLSTNPATAFIETLSTVLASNLAHVRTRSGGIPVRPELCGWTKEQAHGELEHYKAHGTKLGWIDWPAKELLLDPSTIAFITRNSQGRLAMTQQTLLKRLKDEAVIARYDAARQRNTVRVVCEGHARQVIALSTVAIFGDD